MKKDLLIKMLNIARNNGSSSKIDALIMQIAVDPELLDTVNLEDFASDMYEVRHINWIQQCFNFKIR
jgi:hypothetical protein